MPAIHVLKGSLTWTGYASNSCFKGKPNLDSLCQQFMFSVFETTITLHYLKAALVELCDRSVPIFLYCKHYQVLVV